MTTEKIATIAQVCHEINKAYCEAIGDNSQLTWEGAPDWQKSSAIDGVLFHLNNPEAKADASHINWSMQKVNEGWKYGEIKDPENKLHPCLVPFSSLPKEQQVKDYLFKQVVDSLK